VDGSRRQLAGLQGLRAKSIYQYKLLVRLCESGFYLAQEFYHYNPAKLPTPAQWVTVRRMRVKDAVNNVFWLTLDPFADADNHFLDTFDVPIYRQSFDEVHSLMAGEAKADEPFAVDFLGQFFQQCYAAPVVFNQLIIR
jgi:hypothetical protein